MLRIALVCPVAAVVLSCASRQQPAPLEVAAQTTAPKAAEQTAEPALPQDAMPTLKLPSDVRPTHYALGLTIAPESEGFFGTAEIAIELDKPHKVLWMHGRNLHVTFASAEGSGKTLEGKFEQLTPDGMARLTLPRAIGPGKATLRIAWDAEWDPQLAGLYRAKEGGKQYAFTQFEAIDARRAFPGFDEPIFKTPYDVTLTVPNGNLAVANSLPVDETLLPSGMKRIRFATTLPIPTYLVAWQVGPFDVLETVLPPNEIRKRPLPVRGVAAQGRKAELSVAIAMANKLLPALERYFGSEYPYDKLDHIAVPDFSYGAMENVGAITYREQLLLFEKGKTSEDQRAEIAMVVAHEMAHQWFGDLVTLRWWTDAWLNESFATWLSYHVVQGLDPAMQAQLVSLKSAGRVMSTDALLSARAIRQPVETTGEIWNAFDGLTYEKGAAVLNMFERWAGPEKFQAGIREYVDSHRFGGGSTDELLASLDKATGRDLATPFRTFIEQAGVPTLEGKVTCDASGARLALSQRRYFTLGSAATAKDRAAVWGIPICARYGTRSGVKQSCTLLAAAEGALKLDACPNWIVPNADADGYYRWSLAPDDLGKLRKNGYAKLSVRERVSFASSVRAAMWRGAIAEKDGLAALENFAADSDGAVAAEPISTLRFVRDHLVPESLRPRVEAYARKLYRPSYDRHGWTGPAEESRLARTFRTSVLEFLIETGNDPEVRREAARRGRAFAGLADKKFHPEAVDPDLAEIALAAATAEDGKPMFDALEERLGAEEDTNVRELILTALAYSKEPALLDRALALSLDPRLKQNERLHPLFVALYRAESRERAWTFLQANIDPLSKLLSESLLANLASAGSSFCDAKHLGEVEALLGPRVEKLMGALKVLRESQERVRGCIAQVDAQRASTAEFFAGPGRAGEVTQTVR